jgi:drug/metabolite transporter (DMT)-like permease
MGAIDRHQQSQLMQLRLPASSFPSISPWLIAPFFLWGTAMVAMKGAVPHTSPLFMAGFRLLPAGILVLMVAAWLKRPQPQTWKAWLGIGFFALVDGTLFQGLLAEGLARTSAGLGSVMIDSQPLAVALLSSWLFGEVIGLWGWMGLGLGVIGISAIGLPDGWVLNLLHLGANGDAVPWEELFAHGEWLMLLSALAMAVGTVTIRLITKYVDPIVATGWHMILGGLPLFAMSGVWESHQIGYIDFSGWMALLYSAIFGSAIAYGLFFYFAANGNLTSLSSLTFLTPIFAILFGNLFLAEELTTVQWVGVSLTLVSIYLINQRQAIASKLQQIADWRSLNLAVPASSSSGERDSNLDRVSVKVQEAEF